MTNEERLSYRQGVYAIALGMNQAGVTPADIQKRVMKISDEKLVEITNRFGELAKEVLKELGL